ncbi:hypothetical protein [Pseudoclavibacter sp. AY1F1]|uniref:hypothetical protein n=1 Tax=Pseudoclavibacter sp. AY1F1 TaxID=2080583 RepID=UPI0011B004FF|nr:hypothetical protein [Pseudoclavibacter sp. AY1F1]
MLLLDLKYYASGDVTWFSPDGDYLLCRDNPTGREIGSPRRMSRNMKMAHSRFKALFPDHDVRAYVVLIPTNAGLGEIARGTAWPGHVPLVGLPDILDVLRATPQSYAENATDAELRTLLNG